MAPTPPNRGIPKPAITCQPHATPSPATRQDSGEVHEHSCLRCSMHWPDPAQRQRIAEIRDNLIARIAEAEREGWLGEVEGLQISLAGANDKLAQIDRRSTAAAVNLGLPNTQHPKTSWTQGHS